jgi:hypothetical protein
MYRTGGMRESCSKRPHAPCCAAIFSHTPATDKRLTSEDIVGPAKKAEELFKATCLTPTTGATIRKLADLHPKTLALMHGSSFNGDAHQALNDLADLYEGWLWKAEVR